MKITLDIPDDTLADLKGSYVFDCEAYAHFGNENPDGTFEEYLVRILHDWGSFSEEIEDHMDTLYDIRKMVDSAIEKTEERWK